MALPVSAVCLSQASILWKWLKASSCFGRLPSTYPTLCCCCCYCYYYYYCFTALWILSGSTQVSQYQKGKTKTNLDFMEQETVSGSGISWAICKSAPNLRQTTMPAPHQSIFYRCPSCRQTNSVKALKAMCMHACVWIGITIVLGAAYSRILYWYAREQQMQNISHNITERWQLTSEIRTRYFSCSDLTSAKESEDLLDPSCIVFSTDCSHKMSSLSACCGDSSSINAAWTPFSASCNAVISWCQSAFSFSSRHRKVVFPGCAANSWLLEVDMWFFIGVWFSTSLPTS